MDVARAAGVGKSTVSNVLNGTGRVGEAARIRVLETVEQLGYQPHQGARSMRSRRTMRLAYLMPPIQLEPTNLIMMQFMQALLIAAARQHYGVLVVPEAADPSDDIRRLVADRSVDAFVLSDLRAGDPRADLLRRLGMPFACFGRTAAAPSLAWVDIDDVAAEAEAVAHVVARGYRRPGYIGYEPRTPWDADREAGFRTGLAAAGLADRGGLADPAGESAGVLMPSGCRMGVCFGCVVPLRSGTVRDVRNGDLTSANPGDGVLVQTCISAAAGSCQLDV